MKSFVAAASFAVGATAASLPRTDQCCFGLTASGGRSGTLGQLGDGQNRIGGGLSPATYCLSGSSITDASGRGCILTPPTTQFQCDTGATPSSGFSVGSNGELEHNGDSTFYACPASDSEYNIYTQPVSGQSKCVEVTLSTGGKCAPQKPTTTATCPAPSTVTKVETQAATCPPASTVTSWKTVTEYPQTPVQQTTWYPQTTVETYITTTTEASPTTQASSPSACQTDLSGAYQTPHLIVPISSSSPDTAYGTQYDCTLNDTTSTIFNFDIPSSYAGKTCSIVFLFPEQKDLETSSFTFNGQGSIDFAELSSAASQQTSWSNAPAVKSDLGSVSPQPGNSYVIASQSCEAGMTESIELTSKDGLSLEFFEDYNPSPIGVYITAC